MHMYIYICIHLHIHRSCTYTYIYTFIHVDTQRKTQILPEVWDPEGARGRQVRHAGFPTFGKTGTLCGTGSPFPPRKIFRNFW